MKRKLNKLELIGICVKVKEFIKSDSDDYRAYRLGKLLLDLGIGIDRKVFNFSPMSIKKHELELGSAVRPNRPPVIQREPPFTEKDVCRYFGVPFITETKIEFKPIKTKDEMKENENNSHYIVKTKSGNREKIVADQVRQSEGMIKFYKGSDEVAIFNNDSVESIVKGREIETR